MSSRKISLATKILLTTVLASDNALAVTLPSRLPAFSNSRGTIDLDLEKWLQRNAEVMPVSEMNQDQIMLWISDKDPVARALIILQSKYSKPSDSQSDRKHSESAVQSTAKSDLEKLRSETTANVPSIIKKELTKSPAERSPLVADLYLAWDALTPSSVESEALEQSVFSQEPQTSCAAKTRSIKSLTRERLSNIPAQELLEAVAVAQSYKSLTHRRKYLESIATYLPEKRRSEVLLPLKASAKDLPLLLRRFSWLQDDDFFVNQPNSIFAEVTHHVRKKKCVEAESSFLKQLKNSLPQNSVGKAVEAGSEIERCFRAERKGTSHHFWSRAVSSMESRYGKEGLLWVKVRLGYAKWVTADLVEATKIFENILNEAGSAPELRMIVGKSNYMLGKIAEDDGDLNLASKYFSAYIENYSDLEDFEFAINSLVVNFAAKKMWSEMLPPLENFLKKQSLVHMDKRPVGLMAFCLFWQGRAHLQLGNAGLAQEIWRRLAGEYYSTFYGAMGHYLLEQTSGRSYAIEPSRVVGFDFKDYEKNLDSSNKLAVKIALAFLQAGFPEKARCEVEEVVAVNSNDNDSLLVRTLLLHASGGWLDAIKIFDIIPRSVRNGLPVGFERVLFPRKYAEIVKAKSAKLDVDPDFVFALMRQESVFSPDAMSPVGAMGLMQLMPSTARLEAGKLSNEYIGSEDRSSIIHALSDEDSLRNPEINVTLGVHHLWRLMKTYKSPIFALTAYNASPAATQKWQRTIATDDWLTFIERIPYKETRAYVKLILRNYFYYKRWYNSPDGKSQIHIDSVVDELVTLAKNTPGAMPYPAVK